MKQFLKDIRAYENILVLQQYSMRDQGTNIYNLLLDGNLTFTLYQFYDYLIENPNLRLTITAPKAHDPKQKQLLEDFLHKLFKGRVTLLYIDYGDSAKENKAKFRKFSDFGIASDKYELVINYFAFFSNLMSADKPIPEIHSFLLTKISDDEKDFLDEDFENVLNICKSDNANVYVLNEMQKSYMINKCWSTPPNKSRDLVSEKNNIEKNVTQHSMIINKKLLAEFKKMYLKNTEILTERKSQEIWDYLFRITNTILIDNPDKKIIFCPFRLTDAAYNFTHIDKLLANSNKDCLIIVTNPNNADLGVYKTNIVDISKVFCDVNKKSLFLAILDFIAYTGLVSNKIYVPVFENPVNAIHITLAEMAELIPYNINFIDNRNCDFDKLFENNQSEYVKSYIL